MCENGKVCADAMRKGLTQEGLERTKKVVELFLEFMNKTQPGPADMLLLHGVMITFMSLRKVPVGTMDGVEALSGFQATWQRFIYASDDPDKTVIDFGQFESQIKIVYELLDRAGLLKVVMADPNISSSDKFMIKLQESLRSHAGNFGGMH
jgi:hypothetical protein